MEWTMYKFTEIVPYIKISWLSWTLWLKGEKTDKGWLCPIQWHSKTSWLENHIKIVNVLLHVLWIRSMSRYCFHIFCESFLFGNCDSFGFINTATCIRRLALAMSLTTATATSRPCKSRAYWNFLRGLTYFGSTYVHWFNAWKKQTHAL